jgi:hypothetical protein
MFCVRSDEISVAAALDAEQEAEAAKLENERKAHVASELARKMQSRQDQQTLPAPPLPPPILVNSERAL